MGIGSIIAIVIIVAVSVRAVLTAKEPLDEVFAVEAAINGFSMQPLATKVLGSELGRRPKQDNPALRRDARPEAGIA